MAEIPINIPRNKGKIIWNHLHEENPIALLSEDVAFVHLVDGTHIDVGWYPPHDPEGSYAIRMYGEDWMDKLTEDVWTKDPHQAAREVERLALWYEENAEKLANRIAWFVVAFSSGVLFDFFVRNIWCST